MSDRNVLLSMVYDIRDMDVFIRNKLEVDWYTKGMYASNQTSYTSNGIIHPQTGVRHTLWTGRGYDHSIYHKIEIPFRDKHVIYECFEVVDLEEVIR